MAKRETHPFNEQTEVTADAPTTVDRPVADESLHHLLGTAALSDGEDIPYYLAETQNNVSVAGISEEPSRLHSIRALLAGIRAGTLAGRRFGPYIVYDRIGLGGMAEVYLAGTENETGHIEPCVYKQMLREHLDHPELRQLFDEEARISRRLDHPAIVRCLDAGEFDGSPYLVFELVDGVTLDGLADAAGDDGLPLPVIRGILADVASALAYAQDGHDAEGARLGVIHRDVCKHNILANKTGAIKLADFGIARFEGRRFRTQFGPPRGKLRYLAPEQLAFEDFDYKVDVFALGVIAVEILTAQVLFPEGCLAHPEGEARVVDCLRYALRDPSDAMRALLKEMTAFDPAARPTWPQVEARLAGLDTSHDYLGQVAGYVELALEHAATHSPASGPTLAGRPREASTPGHGGQTLEATIDEGALLVLPDALAPGMIDVSRPPGPPMTGDLSHPFEPATTADSAPPRRSATPARVAAILLSLLAIAAVLLVLFGPGR